jgi:hypothetical protein
VTTAEHESHSHDGVVEVEIPLSPWNVIRGIVLAGSCASLAYGLYRAWQTVKQEQDYEDMNNLMHSAKMQDLHIQAIARQEIARFVAEASVTEDVADEETKSDEDKVL